MRCLEDIPDKPVLWKVEVEIELNVKLECLELGTEGVE